MFNKPAAHGGLGFGQLFVRRNYEHPLMESTKKGAPKERPVGWIFCLQLHRVEQCLASRDFAFAERAFEV